MALRTIIFRGKRKDNGEWVEGYYVCFAAKYHYIYTVKLDIENGCLEFVHYEVDPETVGQYTGLTDKNGKKIFEGDMFSMDDEIIAVVIFKDGCFRMESYGYCGTYTESGYDECGGGWGVIECEPIDWYYVRDMKIIGNRWDNPELLKDGE